MALPSRRSLPTPGNRANVGALPKRNSLLLPRMMILISISLLVYILTFVDLHYPSVDALSLRTSATISDSSSTMPLVFSLLVTLQFSTAEYKDQFLQDIQPVAEHCRTKEPDTLAYEVLLSDKDPLQVLVLERYRDKEVAYLQVHKSSAPFLAFRPKLQAMQEGGHVQITGHSYLDSGVGYGDRT
jgi:quinol monooxygenase YgiN